MFAGTCATRLPPMSKKPKRNIAASAGRWSARHKKTAVIGWIAFTILAYMAGGSVGLDSLKSTDLGVGDAGRAEKLVGDSFPSDAGTEGVLISSKTLKSSDPKYKQQVSRLADKLAATPHVKEVESPYSGRPEAANKVAKDGRTVMLTYELSGTDDQGSKFVKAPLHAIASQARGDDDVKYEPYGE